MRNIKRIAFIILNLINFFFLSFIIFRNKIHITNKIRKSLFRIKGSNNKIFIQKDNYFYKCKFIILGSNNFIKIGNKNIFKKSTFYIEGNNSNISIGDFNTSEGSYLSSDGDNSITIGNNCMISRDTFFFNSDSHPIYSNNDKTRLNFSSPIKLKDNVWVGAFSKVLKGVNIESNCVIGLGSVLTKSTKSNTIYAGVPAKEIKTDVIWKRDYEK
jgi:acetyltransferase-like isoleucine patch superfamily enzyme